MIDSITNIAQGFLVIVAIFPIVNFLMQIGEQEHTETKTILAKIYFIWYPIIVWVIFLIGVILGTLHTIGKMI